MSKYYSYVVARDFGFAPNPFGQHCTLATCKPLIRNKASIGDWIFGLTSLEHGKPRKLVYAMMVDKIITFNEYFEDPNFQYKKPVANGSLKKMYGDNIYHYTMENKKKVWHQSNSHHSLDNGELNEENLDTDTSRTENVLISDRFYYFGDKPVEIPKEIFKAFDINRNHRLVSENEANIMIKLLGDSFEIGLHGDPREFGKEFKRYNGTS